jgi:hypothetical protein
VGPCVAGTVIGCDQTTNNCFAAFGRIDASKSWYVCSTDAVCPVTEKCNGIDDDCDGKLAGAALTPPFAACGACAPPFPSTTDEYDHDNDKYLACSGCDPTALATGLTGCGDCDDTRSAVHPGASDLCNGINDNCRSDWTLANDGSDACPGTATPNCCPAQGGCKNVTSGDPNNCGSCGNRCSALTANACGGGGCLCGSNPACGSNYMCSGSSCSFCNSNTHCGSNCAACGTGQRCTVNGSTSTCGCTDDTGCPLSAPYCDPQSGACSAKAPNGHACTTATASICTSGKCYDNVCCGSGCGQECVACNLANSSGVVDGVCRIVGAGAPVSGSGTARSCCGGQTCDGVSADCPAVQCSAQTCSGNTKTAASNCATTGTCPTGGRTTCGGNLNCNSGGTDCLGSCSGDGDCVSGYYCDQNSTCQSRKSAGASCNTAAGAHCLVAGCAECDAGAPTCLDGVCCTSPTCPQCRNCASGTGMCTVVVMSMTDGTANLCDASSSPQKTCDGTGNCKIQNGQPVTCPANASQCLTGFCNTGVCCSTSCGACGNCASPSAGTCTVAATGTVCNTNYLCPGGSNSACPSACTDNTVCATTAGACCNGATCGQNTAADHCGASCKDCTSAANMTQGNKCIANPTLDCGCSVIGDCNNSPTVTASSCGTLTGKTVCLCGAGAACTTAGQCCNGTSCGTQDSNSNCGSSCTNCAGQATNKACVTSLGGKVCGCTGNGDCMSGHSCVGITCI